MHTLGARASLLFYWPVLRAALGGRCHQPHWTDEENKAHSFVLGLLHSFTSPGPDKH